MDKFQRGLIGYLLAVLVRQAHQSDRQNQCMGLRLETLCVSSLDAFVALPACKFIFAKWQICAAQYFLTSLRSAEGILSMRFNKRFAKGNTSLGRLLSHARLLDSVR